MAATIPTHTTVSNKTKIRSGLTYPPLGTRLTPGPKGPDLRDGSERVGRTAEGGRTSRRDTSRGRACGNWRAAVPEERTRDACRKCGEGSVRNLAPGQVNSCAGSREHRRCGRPNRLNQPGDRWLPDLKVASGACNARTCRGRHTTDGERDDQSQERLDQRAQRGPLAANSRKGASRGSREAGPAGCGAETNSAHVFL